MRKYALLGALGALAIGSIGCGGDPTVDVPKFQNGQGQTQNVAEYPAGPYGINVGSVVPDYHFVGFVNSVVDRVNMQPINLSDMYNPHATDPSYQPAEGEQDDRYYPAGSQFGEGSMKPTALLIDVSAVWCPPCNAESATVLDPQHMALAPSGGQFLLDLTDGPNPGTAATPADLIGWTSKYNEDFPAVIDPEYELAALFAADFFPANLVVNPRNMKICKVISGAPDPATWALFNQVMTGTVTCD